MQMRGASLMEAAQRASATIEEIITWMRQRSRGRTHVVVQEPLPRGMHSKVAATFSFDQPSLCDSCHQLFQALA